MRRLNSEHFTITFFTLIVASLLPQLAIAAPQEADASDSINSAVDRLAAKAKYEFKYSLKEKQKLFWKVEHVTTTKTQIAGKTEEASARVETLSSWNVGDVNKSSGEMVFQNTITAIKAWKRIGEEEATLYDSRVSKNAPDEYVGIASSLGKPRSRITIAPNGNCLLYTSPSPRD